MMNTNIKSIILLSGGLDSVVSLSLAKEELNIVEAIVFDYGQKSAKQEIEAAQRIAEFYHINLEIIKLDFLKKNNKNITCK